jgi:hypothetical protein
MHFSLPITYSCMKCVQQRCERLHRCIGAYLQPPIMHSEIHLEFASHYFAIICESEYDLVQNPRHGVVPAEGSLTAYPASPSSLARLAPGSHRLLSLFQGI